jgi:DNA-binding CsgD family transcriptional regulator
MEHGVVSGDPLLERATEIAAIDAAISLACGGTGAALLIEGAAGIGKTRLLRYAGERAAASGMIVLTARAAEYEDGYAWGVVRQLFEAELRAQVHAAERVIAGHASEPLAGDAARPLAGDAVELAGRVLFQGGTPREEDAFALLHGLYWLTADIAQRAPLLIAIDDLHWADAPSQRFVAHLARRLDGLQVLLAATIREPRAATARDKALTAALATEPGVRSVRPAALSADACARLVGGTLGTPPAESFTAACLELTGGNPLLLHGLVAALAADGITGTKAEVPHLRRLTPGSISRHVLLRLGRMPPPVLAAARAIAVLGNSATTARVGWLADLPDNECAASVGTLMAEQLIEGERSLRFVHPLVRSAVYEDLAPPVRQQWHKRVARRLATSGAPTPEVTVHLIAAAAEGDPWVTGQLRLAARDARWHGAPEVAAQCLERALAEPPPAELRASVLYELGAAQTFHAPAVAVDRLTEALPLAGGWPLRGQVALALGEALALRGRFADAVATVQGALRDAAGGDPNFGSAGIDGAEPGGADIGGGGLGRADADGVAPGGAYPGRDGLGGLELDDAELDEADLGTLEEVVASLQAVLLNIARWDLSTRMLTRPLVEELLARTEAGLALDPQLHANLAIELTVAGADRERALRHAREAVRRASRLMSLTSTALPEAVLVLSLADASVEAWAGVAEWQEIARRRGRPVAAAMAASIAAHIAARDGDIRQALAFGEQAMTADDSWVAILAAAFVVPALIDAGQTDQAKAMLASRGLLTGELLPVFPFNVAKYARGCLHAARGDHEAAIADLSSLGADAARWGIVNPAAIAWRSAAALSRTALGDRDAARLLAAEEVALARRWGASREIGMALRAAGLVEGGSDGIALLTEAVSVLRDSPARLELARALLDLGAAQRRAGGRTASRELLRESLDLAHALGGRAVAERARDELVAAGGRPRRAAIRGRDALTPSELRVVELAAAGRTNRQIAQALFVTQRTVENHLTSAYAKLGITARAELGTALSGRPSAATGAPRTVLTSH